MDSLIRWAPALPLPYSLVSLFRIVQGDHHAVHSLYFESGGVLILLGKSLEPEAGDVPEKYQKLMGLAPKTATVLRGRGGPLPIDEVEVTA